LAILNTGLVTSVGLSAPTSCAAMRARVTNPSETRFIDSGGEWITAHQVSLEQPWRGLAKLARMATMAAEEALVDVPKREWGGIPMLLCVAERERPGRLEGLDDQLFEEVQQALGMRFATESIIVPHGRVAVAVALSRARVLVQQHGVSHVLIVAADSLLNWPTLSHYERQDRLLTGRNSNGFMPGEGAGALLVGKSTGGSHLACSGIGFGVEKAHIDSQEPLRAEGLMQAIKAALVEAKSDMHEMDFRIADLSGEQYYFKEAALALSRTLRRRKDEFDLWHPAESTGEAGAMAGLSVLALADAACRKGYAHGPAILVHMANDDGRRAAVALYFEPA
jgi:3-oxoacyl-[acyl-carrier-protein] synthase-1